MAKGRALVIGELRLRWVVRHRHDSSAERRCAEVLSVWPEDGGARLQLEFIAAPGRRVGDGPLHEGGVADDARGLTYNLHEPGVVRRLVDAAIERGYRVDGPPMTLDGWLVLPGP